MKIPKIKNIHQEVYAKASAPGALEMSIWHTCENTHCRAGWVIALAGKAGRELESNFNTETAADFIYQMSSPLPVKTDRFYDDNETALADMKWMAEKEKALAPVGIDK